MQRSNTSVAEDIPNAHRLSKRKKPYRIEYRCFGRYVRNPELWHNGGWYHSKKDALRAMENMQRKHTEWMEYRYPDDNPP